MPPTASGIDAEGRSPEMEPQPGPVRLMDLVRELDEVHQHVLTQFHRLAEALDVVLEPDDGVAVPDAALDVEAGPPALVALRWRIREQAELADAIITLTGRLRT